jgi:hypothetical protein
MARIFTILLLEHASLCQIPLIPLHHEDSFSSSSLYPSHRAVTVVVTVSVLTLTPTPVACDAKPVTGTMVRTPVTEVAVAPPDETAVTGGRGADAALVAGVGCTDCAAGAEVEASVGAAGAGGSELAIEVALDCVNVVLGTVTKAVEMVETVTVVVG